MLIIYPTNKSSTHSNVGTIRANYNKLTSIFGEPIYTPEQYNTLPQVKWDLAIEYEGNHSGNVTVYSEVVDGDDVEHINEWQVAGQSRFNLFDLEEFLASKNDVNLLVL